MAVEATNKNNDSINLNSRYAKKYRKANKEKIEARRLSQNEKMDKECMFCGSTENLEKHHFAGYRFRKIFVTACKDCHELIEQNQVETTWKQNNKLSDLPQYQKQQNDIDMIIENPYQRVIDEIAKMRALSGHAID